MKFDLKVFFLSMAILLLIPAATPEAAKRIVRVGVYQNVPLTVIDANQGVEGFFVDILRHIAEKENWQIDYVPAPWSECLDNLKQGRIDLLGVIAYSADRDRIFDYTYESVLSEWGQIYSRHGAGIESVLDLGGHKIAVLKDDMHFFHLKDLLDQFGINSRFIEAFEYEDVLALVEIGKCDAGLVSQFYGMQHENDYAIQKTSIILSPQKLYWASPQNRNQDLLTQLDSHLRRLKADEKSIYYEFMNKWFGLGPTSDAYRWLQWAVMGLLGLLLLAGFVIVAVRAQVKSRTKELIEQNRKLLSEIEQRRQAELGRAALETKLIRARKMEALGTLAGGVAHDLNNVLSGIVSYPELLLLQLPENSPLRKPILTIKGSGEKAARIVEDLLTLARRGVAVSEIVSMNQVVADFLESPEYEKITAYHSKISIATRLEPNLLNIMGSSIHLFKSLMNLVSNAAEAMPAGGRIFISTQNRYIDSVIRGYDDIEEGDYVLLAVEDCGTGIPETDLEHIFEPFYTKKAMGRSGTGLGMAVVWGTVKDHKGYIDVHTRDGAGTCFTLYFPATLAVLAPEGGRVPLSELMGAGQRVLVIDDIKEQREIASQMLMELGYDVAAVSSGEEAVSYLRVHEVDVLVLDMIMGLGIDGLETYRRIVKIKPGQKAIIASGFSETRRVKLTQSLGAGEYVQKPYTLEKIGLALKKALNLRSEQ